MERSNAYYIEKGGLNTLLGVASGLQIHRAEVWSTSATVPSDIPSDMTYGMVVVYRVENTNRYFGFALSIASERFLVGVADTSNLQWFEVAIAKLSNS